MEKKSIIAGNWKMNKDLNEGVSFVETAQNMLLDLKNVSVIFSPPFIGLSDLKVQSPFLRQLKIVIGKKKVHILVKFLSL